MYSQGCYTVGMPMINGKEQVRFLETFIYTGKTLFLSRKWKFYVHKTEMDSHIIGCGTVKNVSVTTYIYVRMCLQQIKEQKHKFEIKQYLWYKKMCHAMEQVLIYNSILHLIKITINASFTLKEKEIMIWHNCLSIFWHKGTQSWLKSFYVLLKNREKDISK